MSSFIDISKYIHAFTHLNTDKSPARWSDSTKHRAPHKPLLLLSIIDLFAQGLITTNLIEPNIELGDVFSLYWAKVIPPDKDGNMALPFYHLKSDKFWHLQAKLGNENLLKAQIRSISQLRDAVYGAKLDDELYILLQSEQNRKELQIALISTYFATLLQDIILKQSLVNFEAYNYSEKLLMQARYQVIIPLSDRVEQPVRDQGFRRAVVSAYDHRCAFCGVRMLTPKNHTAVDAAHIIPWSKSFNDDPRNGLALCKLCHWTFDEGLISVSNQYKILVSPQLSENSNISGHLGTLNQRNLILPNEQVLYPELANLEWHRRECFYSR